MSTIEYLLSLTLALLMLGGMVAWTQATDHQQTSALSCRRGHGNPPVLLKGMSIYPRCPQGKRS